MKSNLGQHVMRALSDLRRNDVIRVVTLVSLVAFPLMAYGQLGTAAKGARLSEGAATTAVESVAPAKAVAAGRDVCASQHWPFFSAECLRGSSNAAAPRLVAMNAENPPVADPSPKAPTMHSRQVVHLTDSGNTPVAKSRKPLKPRVAHMRARKPLNLSYASNASAAPVSLPGW